jgi:hypothetical protein
MVTIVVTAPNTRQREDLSRGRDAIGYLHTIWVCHSLAWDQFKFGFVTTFSSICSLSLHCKSFQLWIQRYRLYVFRSIHSLSEFDPNPYYFHFTIKAFTGTSFI